MFESQFRFTLFAAWAVIGLAGCAEGSPPVLQDPGDQVAVVGQALTVNLIASDPDGGRLTFGFDSSIAGISAHAVVRQTPDGQGVFEYTAVAGHEGMHIFDFVASDGDFNTRLPINIEVRGSSGRDGAPLFRTPQAGIAIDANQECGSFDVLVEDVDSTEIELTEVGTPLSGSEFEVGPDGKTATWEWCPTREQRGLGSPAVTLSADDGDNPPTIKEIRVHLQRDAGADCPGEAATVEHTPMDFETGGPLTIQAVIADDQGLLAPPRVLYRIGDGEASVSMTREDGDDLMGTWQAVLENPTAASGEGSSASLHYRIEVTDTDNLAPDPVDSCHHTTSDPATGFHEVRVTNTGGGSGDGAKPCATCTNDGQCGGSEDYCISLEGGDGLVCGASCNTTDRPCGAGFVCSDSVMLGTQGTAGRQCVPESGSCSPVRPPQGCQDDAWDVDGENDDTPDEADGYPIFDDAPYYGNQILCPGDDDYFSIVLESPGHIDLFLDGDYPPDMDLYAQDAMGAEVGSSADDFSTESIYTSCLDAGTYYAVVYWGAGPHEGAANYSLAVSVDPC